MSCHDQTPSPVYFLQTIAITGENVQVKAGQIMLAGQVVDAITTPLVGVLSDYVPVSTNTRDAISLLIILSC